MYREGSKDDRTIINSIICVCSTCISFEAEVHSGILKYMLQIAIVPVTDFQQNCRVVWAEGSPSALIIDPGGDSARIENFLKQKHLVCGEIWLTHSHLDHCGGVAGLKSAFDVPLSAHPVEREFRQRVDEIKRLWGITSSDMTNCPEPERKLEGGETVTFAGVEFQVIFTPGHSPGHLCFYAPSERLIIAGDTLFAGSIGRTDLPGGHHPTLIKSIVEKILVLPDDTRVLSGHGPDTLVGRERKTNPFLTGEMDE